VEKLISFSWHKTYFGNFFIASTHKGICTVSFTGDDYNNSLNSLKKVFKGYTFKEEKNQWHLDVIGQLEEYFLGRRKVFDVPLHLEGTPFQRAVWNELLKIPYGATCTYKDIAMGIGDFKKARACGGAIGKNPVVIIVPCHRVIGSDGNLAGFSAIGGIALKRQLLDLENRYKGTML